MYNRAEAIKLLQERYGYKYYGRNHNESRVTHWFQECYLPKVWGIDKRKPHLSSMINSGQITREQALEELKQPLEGCKYGDEIIEKLGIQKDAIYPKRDYKDYPNNEFWWNLLSQIYFKIKIC